ncbi:Adenylate isopentenyltransferase 5, chloroplastic [Ancistrocladus abbreviatus]
MNISFSLCKQVQAIVSFPVGFNTGSLDFPHHKDKVVFVMGATGTGKSRLSIDLATHFPAEIINSDKIQMYKGLDIATNKMTADECRGIPHHLLGIADPNADFTATDFRDHASRAIESILERDKVPIIAGGSNSFIGSLVNDDAYFGSKYECCFLWVDVSLPILRSFVSDRVDRMVEAGLVDEVRQIFRPNADYTRGIRRAIGVPEMDRFLRAEGNVDKETLSRLLEDALEEIKENNYKLAVCQLQKIHRLRDFWGWNLHRIDATEVFLKGGEEANQAWEKLVVGPSAMIVGQFLHGASVGALSPRADSPIITRTMPMAAIAAATH